MQSIQNSKPIKEFLCDYGCCNKKYKTKFSLRRHYLSHLGIKQFKCTFCLKRFAVAQYLQEHLYTHTGERPFVCTHPGCSKTFRQAGKLSIHRKKHIIASKSGSTSLDSAKNCEPATFIQVAHELQSFLDSFQLPDFFYTKELPVPEIMKKTKSSN